MSAISEFDRVATELGMWQTTETTATGVVNYYLDACEESARETAAILTETGSTCVVAAPGVWEPRE